MSAASLPWRSASSVSSATCWRLVPEMLRVPPVPAPSEVDRLVHRGQDLGVLAHAEIVVAAPHRDALGSPSGTMPDRCRELARNAFESR